MAKKQDTISIGFEEKIWKAADILRGNLSASQYEGVVLGLIFLKYISDRFEQKFQELQGDEYADPEDKDEYTAENIFFVPAEARWSKISAAAHLPEIGVVIDDALTAIERENERLKGILPKNFARQELDKRRLGDVNVKIPFYRTDISIVEDIAEEVGRLHGFHNITPTSLRGDLLSGKKSEKRQVEDRVKEILYGCGMFEIMTYSFISKKSYEKALISYNPEKSIELLNPLGEDFSVMRTTTLTNILDVLEKNSKNKIPSMNVYELANTFLKDSKGNYGETKKIGLGMYGDVDFYSIKEVTNTLLNELGIKNASYVALTDNKTYHPGRAAKIYIDDIKVGEIGEISFDLAKNYDINSRVYIGELDLNSIMPHIVKDKIMEEIIKYPSIERDIAIVIDRDLETDVLEKFMIENGSDLLKSVELFDVYMGGNIEKDKKSSAYKLKFQSKDRTLREEEISDIMKNIISKLEEKFDAQLRS